MRGPLFTLITLVTVVLTARPTPRISRISTTTVTTTTEKEIELPKIQLNATWECGTDDFTKAISEGEISSKCPNLRDHVNSCCYSHDQCYVDQLGQKHCDDAFCNCLEKRTRSSKACHEESSPIFCELVRSFGDDAYKNSGPNATTTDEGLVEKSDYDYESTVKNATLVFE